MKQMKDHLGNDIMNVSEMKQILDAVLRKPDRSQIVITTNRENYNLIMKWLKEQEKIKNFVLC